MCETQLIKPEGEAVRRCPNPNCPGRKRQAFQHFVSRGAMDIDSLGEKVIDSLIDFGFVHDFADLFTLTQKQLLELPLFKQKRAKNILEALESRKQVAMSRFIFGLGIRHVGAEVAKLLVKALMQHHDLKSTPESLKQALLSLSEEELLQTDGLGPRIVEAIKEWSENPASQHLLDKFEEIGLRFTLPEKSKEKEGITGKTFVITGTLSKARGHYKKTIESLGGKVSSSVSSKTDYLLLGEDAGSKLKKAKEHGTAILSEEAFEALIQ